jgi:hypothetical protein
MKERKKSNFRFIPLIKNRNGSKFYITRQYPREVLQYLYGWTYSTLRINVG